MIELTQETIKKYLDYDPRGFLIWRLPRSRIQVGDVLGKNTFLLGYRKCMLFGKPYKVSRLIFFWHHGYFPRVVDHINRVRDDDRIENLREASYVQNNGNRSLSKYSNKSGYKGVSFDKLRNKWRAQITQRPKVINLGCYDTPEAAARAYDKAAFEYFQEFSKLNFPRSVA